MFLNLGTAPPSNAYLTERQLSEPEVYYPLQLYVCHSCWLVQLPAHLSAAQTFTADYAYFSSYSKSWVAHAGAFVDHAVDALGLGASSFVAEVASNDGYLLQHVRRRGIRCLGIEPTASTAAAARDQGIETVEVFLGAATARELVSKYGRADLVVANNVLAHVPDLHDFIEGLRTLLAPGGTLTIELPHLLRLLKGVQFDTVYHEHYSYFSLQTVIVALRHHDLLVQRCEQLDTHGGSLRLWIGHSDEPSGPTDPSVEAVLTRERAAQLQSSHTFDCFQQRAEEVKRAFLTFLLQCKADGKKVVAYGAAAKGNTLLNFCGVRGDLLAFVADANPKKQGKYMPGSRIPIVAPQEIDRFSPEFVVVLPWNLQEEMEVALKQLRSWGAKFVYAVPSLRTR